MFFVWPLIPCLGLMDTYALGLEVGVAPLFVCFLACMQWIPPLNRQCYGHICPGFEGRGGSLTCLLPYLHSMNSSDLLLVRHFSYCDPRICAHVQKHWWDSIRDQVSGTVRGLTVWNITARLYFFVFFGSWFPMVKTLNQKCATPLPQCSDAFHISREEETYEWKNQI